MTTSKNTHNPYPYSEIDRNQLVKLAEGKLDPETRRRIQEQLQNDELAALEFADVVSQAMDEGRIETPDPAPHRPPVAFLKAFGMVNPEGETVWDRLEKAVQDGLDWACAEMERMVGLLDSTLNLWSLVDLAPVPLPDKEMGRDRDWVMGESGSWGDVEQVESSASSERKVEFIIDTPPMLTCQGDFRFCGWTEAVDVKGGTLYCSMGLVQGVRLVFEGPLKQGAAGREWSFDIRKQNVLGHEIEQSRIVPRDQIKLFFREKVE